MKNSDHPPGSGSHRLPAADVLSRNCPSREVIQQLTGRWPLLVMLALNGRTLRFAELRRRTEGISERMLAQTLRTLEGYGLVTRRDHGTVPPHVDYALTPLGAEAAARILGLSTWIEANLAALVPATENAV